MADGDKTQNGTGNGNGNGNDDVGGGGGNVSFSGFTYNDPDADCRADIELIDDRGGQIQEIPDQAPSPNETTVNGVTGVNQVNVTIKKDGHIFFLGTMVGRPTANLQTRNYYRNARINVAAGMTLRGAEMEDDF